ncbi:DegT/DnrJ/EryC1/StrS family aminotransferase [Marinobacteraceae bacterium S3BR75-40.1]
MSLTKVRPVGSRVPKPGRECDLGPLEGAGYLFECFDSGTSALSVAVKCALASFQDVRKPEVLLPAYGCPDLVAAVIAQGCTPRLVDLEGGTPWMDLSALEASLSGQTVAIIAVDFLGISERLEQIREIASRAGIYLIEDSAQRFPPSTMQLKVADFAIVSFGRGKPINLMGGGALLVRDDHQKLSAPVTQAFPSEKLITGPVWHIKRVVFNALMHRMIYGVLEKLPFLKLGQTSFNQLGSIYRRRFDKHLLVAGISMLKRKKGLENSYTHKFAQLEKKGWVLLSRYCAKGATGAEKAAPLLRYPLLAPNRQQRDDKLRSLNDAGIGANAFYAVSLPRIPGIKKHIANPYASFEAADDFADRLLTLPCHEDVRTSDIDRMQRVLLNNQA